MNFFKKTKKIQTHFFMTKSKGDTLMPVRVTTLHVFLSKRDCEAVTSYRS